MIKRILIVLLTALAGLNVSAGEMEDALKSVDAPGGEFVRMPARYIFQRLERQAQNSGLPILGGFSIEARVEGTDAKKINVAFDGMNMLEALNATSKATGTWLVFEGTVAVMGDASVIDVKTVEVEEEPEEEEDDGEDVKFQDVDAALVFVETGAGRGSAFIAKQDGKTYVFSNQHNFMGATKFELNSMHCGPIKFESFEFCRSRDLVRFELSKEKNPDLGVLKMSATPPYIEQKIAVYGNSAGGNVATELRGEVLGVGPRDIEVDADIVSGNSGSPILDVDGRVIGVATYVAFELKFDKKDHRSQIFKGTRFNKTRRYGVRIPDDGWVKVDMRQFLNQTYMIADWQSYLELMGILIQYWGGLEDYEDYEEAANLIMDTFSTQSSQVDRPYEFHSNGVESEVEMAVKSFKRNYEEFKALVVKADLDKKELAKLSNVNKSNSSSKIERQDYYIRTSMLSKAKALQADIQKQKWMSEYLEGSAETLEKIAGELVLRLEGKKNLYPRAKAAM